jgi:hypothetical protein
MDVTILNEKKKTVRVHNYIMCFVLQASPLGACAKGPCSLETWPAGPCPGPTTHKLSPYAFPGGAMPPGTPRSLYGTPPTIPGPVA